MEAPRVMNYSGSAPVSEFDFSHLWMPFTYHRDMIENPPIVIEKGSGIYIYDTAGRGYIDAIGSWWVSIFGHCNPVINAAIRDQLDKIEHVMMAGFVSKPALRLSHRLGEILPDKSMRIFYSDDGSTAVEVALKIALQYHALRGQNRSEFVALDGGYHGDTLGAMSVGSIPQYHTVFHDTFKKQNFADSPYCYRCPAGCNSSTCNAECMDSLKKILEEKNEKIAGCIFEPMVQGASGMRVYPDKVLRRIFDLCSEYNIITIADEVAMGFGRTGKMFACDHAGRIPDIMCLAKGLTGGYLPLSATVVKDFIFHEFSGDYRSGKIFNHGHTFTGNPLAAAAACASIELITSYNIPASMQDKINRFALKMKEFLDYELVGDVRTLGMVGAIELVKNKITKEKLPPDCRIAYKTCMRALSYGLLIRPLGDVIYFMPPFIITDDQMDDMFYLTHKALKETIDAERSSL